MLGPFCFTVEAGDCFFPKLFSPNHRKAAMAPTAFIRDALQVQYPYHRLLKISHLSAPDCSHAARKLLCSLRTRNCLMLL